MELANALILLLLIAGQMELAVTAVNRIFGLPFRHRALRILRRIHDVLIVIMPFVVLGCVGLSGPRLLRGGTWSDVPWGWRAYFAVCSLGIIGLGVSAGRHLFRRRVPGLVSNHSKVVNIAQAIGRPPIGDGPHRRMTHMPGNQIFEVDFSTRQFALPRLPAAWEGLTILHLSDWHFIGTIEREFFEEVSRRALQQPVDLVVFTGDLLDRQDLLAWLPETLGRFRAPLGCYFILGNHDWLLDDATIRARMQDLGWVDVAGRVVTVSHRGHTLVIGGSERPWMGQHPDFTAADDDGFRLLLSHAPDNFQWAQMQSVDLMLAGHNHGGQVVLPLIGPVYSPSVHGCRYAAGAYCAGPTLLYVSRGLSGRHPLRINCRPEIATLVLQRAASEAEAGAATAVPVAAARGIADPRAGNQES